MRCMKRASALLLLAFAGLTAMQALAVAGNKHKEKTTPKDLAPADALFQAGRFAEAQKIYLDIATKNSKDFQAALQLGYIALLSNKLDDAELWLRKALDLKHGNADAKIMLAEALYRKNDFFHAARELNGLGPQDAAKLANYSTLNAAKLESFRDDDPYKLDKAAGESTRLPFIKSVPLPVVNVKINGGPAVAFFIDTGGSELLLDSEFASELKLKSFGSVQGTFSGGQHAEVGNSRIDSLTLGAWTIRNVPIGTLPIRSMSSMFGVEQIDGCIGTNVLYQFLATIDYRSRELILRKKNMGTLKRFESAENNKGTAVPFLIAGDHFMVAWGQANAIPPSLYFADSGLAGAGVKLAESTLKEAGIKLDESKATEGQGGGGALKTIPYTVNQFSVGDITEHNVAGLYDGPFPWENAFGFRLGGMFGNDFLKPYAVTFDFIGMRIIFR
jgi:tetratricopeptide (TPR) repeat protein